MSTPPLVVECHKVEVLLRIVDALGNLADKVRGSQQFTRRVEEGHRSVDADTHIYMIMFGKVYDESHVAERIPWRQAEHQRQWHFVSQRFYYLNHAVVAVTSSHPPVSFPSAVKRHIQMAGWVASDGIYNPLGCLGPLVSSV